jgi:hypothetical protein
MSSEERPVPIPRPRQSKTSDEIDSSARAYENFTIKPPANASIYDGLNAQLSEMKVEMQKPMPMPRSNKNRNYENAQLNNIANNNSEQPQSYQQPDLPPKTGAIRKTPNIPKEDNLNNNRHETVAEHADDVLSNSSSTSGKSGGEKFITPSPT